MNFYCTEIAIMRKLALSSLMLILMFLGLQATSQSQKTSQLEVEVAAICKSVVSLEPVDSAISFAATVGNLYCFTKITGAQSPTQITHVWHFDGTERARVDLAVNAASWRTYSSKIIQSHEMGSWHVDVLDDAGNLLKTIKFEVVP